MYAIIITSCVTISVVENFQWSRSIFLGYVEKFLWRCWVVSESWWVNGIWIFFCDLWFADLCDFFTNGFVIGDDIGDSVLLWIYCVVPLP